MPADDRLWLQNCNRAEDGREPTIEPNEQEAIGIAELWSLRYLRDAASGVTAALPVAGAGFFESLLVVPAELS